jgi:hypothetical protein
MLKIKLCLISAAIIGSIVGAIASQPEVFCQSQPQYYKFGNSYIPAGDYGVEYYCSGSIGNCTYWQPNPFEPDSYAPCRTGTFNFMLK